MSTGSDAARPNLSPSALVSASSLAAAGDADTPRLRSHGSFLSREVPGRTERRHAVVAIVLSAIFFAAAVPFARLRLVAVPGFIPAYEACLVLIDLLTAVLLFGQFVQLRSAALLILAAGYLFDAAMAVPHALSFPGLISPTGGLGAGSQTTAWLYMFWHGGFPVFVMAYAWLNRRASGAAPIAFDSWSAAWPIAGTLLVAAGLTVLAVHADRLLPPIMAGNGYTETMAFVVAAVWSLSLAALVVLARPGQRSTLDLWLAVVMTAWLFDIALSAVLNGGRFDLGFYAGRAYGLAAASFVLGVILLETSGLRDQLAAAAVELEEHARHLHTRVRERTEELRHSNHLLNAMLEASPVGIFMLDHDGIVRLWTSSAERVFGYDEAESLGRVPPYLSPADMSEFRAKLRLAASGDGATGHIEAQRRHKDGRPIDLSVRWARVDDAAGQSIGTMYAVIDITEAKKTEEQLRQAQKMEAIGNLTGGMAHDFNNLLGIIIGNLELQQLGPADAAERAQLTQEALDAALRGADLTRRLLAFARRQPLKPQRTNINELAARITHLLQRTLGEDIEIALNLQPDVWPVVVDPAQLEAALTNLATNARDAMPDGGRLSVTTGNRLLDDDYAGQHLELAAGDYVLIEVSDTGCGIPPEVASRIFEPFFTTKAPGKGTGLGLAMVFGFMKQSGGHINMYSEVGIGTTIRLYLPRAADLADRDAAGPVTAAVRGNGERVLVVEDNPGLRRVAARQLTDLGYRVIEAENGLIALELLTREAVDALLTDVVMPGGTSGYDLAAVAQSRWPHVKIVLVSGFPSGNADDRNRPAGVRLLVKPYRRDELAGALADALAS